MMVVVETDGARVSGPVDIDLRSAITPRLRSKANYVPTIYPLLFNNLVFSHVCEG